MSEWVVITGASSGIGKAVAERMAAAGWKIIPSVRKEEDFSFWKSRGTHPVLLDVTRPDQVETAAREIAELTAGARRVHLVNNAGIVISGPVEAVPLAAWREQFEVNVFGLLQVTQALLPRIRETQGRVVNLGSVSGLVASPYLGPYCASKYAVEAISDSLRRELRQFGVHVALIEPGPIDTPIWEKSFSGREKSLASFSATRQLYAKGLEKFEAFARVSAAQARPVAEVTKAIHHALGDPRPKVRYLVGERSLGFQLTLVKFLPTSWLDRMIGKQFGE